MKGFYFIFLIHKNQFLKLTNSCCFHIFEKGCAVPACVHVHACAPVSMCVQVRACRCVHVCVRACVKYSRWVDALGIGSWKVLLFGVFKAHILFSPSFVLLGGCVPNTFFSCRNLASGVFSSFPLVTKCFPGAEREAFRLEWSWSFGRPEKPEQKKNIMLEGKGGGRGGEKETEEVEEERTEMTRGLRTYS